METYSITVKETLFRSINIHANSSDEALAIATEMYKNEDIVVSAEDHAQTDIYPSCLYNIEDEPHFRKFLLEKIQEALPGCTVEELAEFAFGNLHSATESFSKQ